MKMDRKEFLTDLLKREIRRVRLTEKQLDEAGLSWLEKDFYRESRQTVKMIGERMRERGMSVMDIDTHWRACSKANIDSWIHRWEIGHDSRRYKSEKDALKARKITSKPSRTRD